MKYQYVDNSIYINTFNIEMKHLLGGIPLLVCLLIDVVIIITESLNLTLAVVCRLLTSRPPPLLPSVCVHNNTWEWKTGKKQGRPENIHHMNDVRWT